MPLPNHSKTKRPGRRKWVTRRNVQRELKRRYDENLLEFLSNIKGTGKS